MTEQRHLHCTVWIIWGGRVIYSYQDQQVGVTNRVDTGQDQAYLLVVLHGLIQFEELIAVLLGLLLVLTHQNRTGNFW